MPRRTLLVVEDDADLRGLYRTTLALEGFEVREAVDGFDALQKLDSSVPDLIVLDLMLPGVNGLAVLREIWSHAQTRRIPVVVVTASPQDLSYLDVSCVLRKPVLPGELVAAIERCLASPTRSLS